MSAKSKNTKTSQPSSRKLEDRIDRLTYGTKVRNALERLGSQSKRAAHKVVTFLQRNPDLTEAMVVGLILAMVLQSIPLFGHFFAMLAMAGAVGIGLLRELRSSLVRAQ